MHNSPQSPQSGRPYRAESNALFCSYAFRQLRTSPHRRTFHSRSLIVRVTALVIAPAKVPAFVIAVVNDAGAGAGVAAGARQHSSYA